MNSSSQGYEFGTRFEGNLIHPSRLVNIDKNFDFSEETAPILDDGSVNPIVTFNKINVVRDKVVLERFIKEALNEGYLQSEENAIKFAYNAGLNISDVVVTMPSDAGENVRPVIDSYYEGTDYGTDYDYPGAESEDFNDSVSTLLPSLVKCPTISNGNVSGYPRQDLFPMMSHLAFRTLTDVSMLNNPSKSSGEYGVPQSVRFNNPFLVDVIEGVTNKLEDGYIGEVGGKAVYANRIGGLIAGIRRMQNNASSGKTLLSAGQANLPFGTLLKYAMNMSQALFNTSDPTGTMLQCAQLDLDNGNVNDQIVTIGMMLSSLTGEKKSPFTYEEIAVALNHIKDKTQFNKTVDGQLIGKVRDPSKEQPIGISKIENTANSTPIQIANTALNGTSKLIVQGKGADLETKNQRKENQSAAYEKYDVGSDHKDRLEQLGSTIVATLAGTKDTLF
jgi:hypothetical protein